MSAFELNRGNVVYDSDLSYPLKFHNKIEVNDGYDSLDSSIRIFGNKLYVSARTYMMCYDLDKEETVWEKRSKKLFRPVYGNENRIYSFLDRIPSCLDADSGEVIWRADNKFFLVGASDDYLFCRDSLNAPETVCCLSQKDGKELWRFKGNGSYSESMSENGITVISTFEEYIGVEDSSGEILWRKNEKELFASLFPDKKMEGACNGPLINGDFIIGYETGDIIAIEVKTGEIKWKKSIDNVVQMSAAKYHNGKLYFPFDHKYSNYEYILCLDFDTGELIFRSDEFVTEKGCINPFISNGFLVGGNKNQIGFYDLEKQKVVHRQEFKGKKFQNLMFSVPLAYKNLLIAWDIISKEIFLFSSK